MQDDTEQPPAATRSRRFFAGVILAASLSAITGVISYEHGLAVAMWLGNHGLVAYLVPLVPDLMIATSSLTLLEASGMRERRPAMAMVALVAGIGWTVAMNIGAGWHEGPGGRVLNAGVPLAFVLTFESLLWLIRRGRGGPVVSPAPATFSQPEPVVPLTTLEALAALVASDSERQLEEVLRIPRSRIQAWKRQVAAVADDPPAGVLAAASVAPPPGANPEAPAGAGGGRGRPHAPAAPQDPRPGPDTPLGPAGAARSPSVPMLGTATAGTAPNGQAANG